MAATAGATTTTGAPVAAASVTAEGTPPAAGGSDTPAPKPTAPPAPTDTTTTMPAPPAPGGNPLPVIDHISVTAYGTKVTVNGRAHDPNGKVGEIYVTWGEMTSTSVFANADGTFTLDYDFGIPAKGTTQMVMVVVHDDQTAATVHNATVVISA